MTSLGLAGTFMASGLSATLTTALAETSLLRHGPLTRSVMVGTPLGGTTADLSVMHVVCQLAKGFGDTQVEKSHLSSAISDRIGEDTVLEAMCGLWPAPYVENLWLVATTCKSPGPLKVSLQCVEHLQTKADRIVNLP